MQLLMNFTIQYNLDMDIQFREPGNYMYNGWFFEQSATHMENVIYPEKFPFKNNVK